MKKNRNFDTTISGADLERADFSTVADPEFQPDKYVRAAPSVEEISSGSSQSEGDQGSAQQFGEGNFYEGRNEDSQTCGNRRGTDSRQETRVDWRWKTGRGFAVRRARLAAHSGRARDGDGSSPAAGGLPGRKIRGEGPHRERPGGLGR